MTAISHTTHGCDIPASKLSFADVPASNGKIQPWRKAWPPSDVELRDVVESKGQMLLLDGTGGSGSKAVPNNVFIPPKPLRPESDIKDTEEKDKPKSEDAKSEK